MTRLFSLSLFFFFFVPCVYPGVAFHSRLPTRTALSLTGVDRFMIMSTYTGDWGEWQVLAEQAVSTFSTEQLVLGLQTVDPNTNVPLNDTELSLRFGGMMDLLVVLGWVGGGLGR